MATDLALEKTIGRGAAPRAIDRSSAPAAPDLSRRARREISLTESVTATLNQLSQHEGVTLFMTLLAAFQVLLYRYSGQEDIMSVRPVANRDKVGSRGHRLSRQHARLARGSFRSNQALRSCFAACAKFAPTPMRIRQRRSKKSWKR